MRVALTFDAEHQDRPQGDFTNALKVLDILDDTPATFFIQGRWATAYPTIAAAITDRGHAIGSHSHSHAAVPNLTQDGIHSDLTSAEIAIRQTTGIHPVLYRAPFGATTPELEKVLKVRGYQYIGWHYNSEDVTRDADYVARNMLKMGEHSGVHVVLMHSWPDATVAALPRILSELQADLVTLGGESEQT